MADASDAAANIFEGVWTDWSKGSTLGLTWTLPPTQAILLTNALAVFVTLSGIQFWAIIRYTLYQLSASTPPEMLTPHLHKRRVILRNATSDLATARLMLNLAWSSRRSSGRRSLSSYSIGLLAIIYALLFMTAGIFSNKAISAGSTQAGSRVLSRSKSCGVWNQTYYDIAEYQNYSTEEEFGLLVQYKAKKAYDIELSFEYAQECYLSQSHTHYMSPVCNTFKTPKLDWKTHEGLCPFQSQICHNKSEVAVLDTGYVDSHDHLGINANPKDRLKYRRITTCAVLNDAYYVTGWNGEVVNSSSPKPSLETAKANYGPSINKGTDYTYSISNFASFYDNFTAQVTNPYQLDVEQAWSPAEPQWSTSDFEPIPELAQTSADLTLLFLSFTGMYMKQVDDPWFSAQNKKLFNSGFSFFEERYERGRAISTLGCTEKHKFCTNNNTCTEFLGLDQVQNVNSFNAALTPHQNATFDRMIRAVAYSGLWHVIENLSLTTTPMLASNSIYSGNSGTVLSESLPDDQWKIELDYWHSIAMAQLQRTVVQWATGQIAAEPQYVRYLLPPTEEQDKWFCKNLIISSIVYQSFSIVAIILILGFGTLVIVASLTVESLAALIAKCFRKPAPRKTWDYDDMLGDRSPWRPQPPPKDEGFRPASRQRGRSETHELKIMTMVPNNNRMSSPTLPPEDLTLSFVDGRINSAYLPEPPPRPARDSWMAISLKNADFAMPEMCMKTPNDDREWMFPRPLPKSRPPPLITKNLARPRDCTGLWK